MRKNFLYFPFYFLLLLL